MSVRTTGSRSLFRRLARLCRPGRAPPDGSVWQRLEPLEPRILFSATIPGADVLADAAAGAVGLLHHPAAEDPAIEDLRLWPSDKGSIVAVEVRREVVFVSADTPDLDRLLHDLGSRSSGARQLDVFVLDAGRDAIEEIGAILGDYRQLDAVHIISHGSAGTVALGDLSLDLDSLHSYAGQIAGWGEALARGGDLLLYGCDVAADPGGVALVQALGQLTGADVAASVDRTGSALLEGDWDLEYRTGLVESALALSAYGQQSFRGVLATITVSTTLDVNDGNTSFISNLLSSPGLDGEVSLREAIIAANNTTGADTVELLAGLYTLALTGGGDTAGIGDLDITDDLTITGVGAGATIVDAAAIDRVFDVNGGARADFLNLTIRNGWTSASSFGGGISISNGSAVSLSGVVVTGNYSGQGAGINNNGGTLTATDSTISNNLTPNWGGGIYNSSGTIHLERVTLSGNTADKNGGGIYNFGTGGGVTFLNVTISGNTADDGGGIWTNRPISVTNSTIAFNTALAGTSGGVNHQGAQGYLVLQNSILANNIGQNSNASHVSLGNNIDSDGTVGLTEPSDQSGVDPLLGPLQDNGGPTATHALLAGSPAIGAGNDAAAPNTDQRGVGRVGTSDIGAYEFVPGGNQPPTTTGIADVVVDEDSSDTVIDLFAAFDDAEDPDANLTFTVESNTNPALFDATSIDPVAGTLTLGYAADTSGSADITVRATDTGGLLVETTFRVTVNSVNDDPVLAVSSGLTVDEGTSATVTDSLLRVTDNDNSASQIVYTLEAAPTNGTLRVNGTALGSNDTFTQQDVDDGLVVYEHDGSETTADSFDYAVSDGAGGSIPSTSFAITVNAQNDTPALAVNAGASVSDLSSAAITSSLLRVTDADNTAAEIVYSLAGLPTNGTLRLSGAALGLSDAFTQQDIDDGLLTYDHENGGTTSDSFLFSVSDGAGGSIGNTVFDITVSGGNSAPVLSANNVLTIDEAGSSTITTGLLETSDAEQSSSQLTYTLAAAPTAGTLRLGGTALDVNDTFTQQDIDTGLITYEHDGSETTSDSFDFTVSDGAGGSVPTSTFTVAVTPQNDDPLLVNNSGSTLDEGSSATLTSALLRVSDVDNTSAEITYSVAATPAYGVLRLGGVTLALNDTFTQQDIDDGLLSYEHDGSETTSDSFDFTVSDGAGGSLPSTSFSIAVSAQNDNPFFVTKAPLSVDEGGTAVIENSTLRVGDTDNTPAEITYTLTTVPTTGTLRLGASVLAANDTFTQQNVDDGLLSYEHDGSESTSSGFIFSVSDGAGGSISNSNFSITVQPQDDAPVLTVNTGLSIDPGVGQVISQAHLRVSDPESGPAQIVYEVTAIPLSGVLTLNGVRLEVGSTFTQEDVNSQRLAYTHDGISSATLDSFSFNYSDSSGGALGTGTFAIQISAPVEPPTSIPPDDGDEPPPDGEDPADPGDDTETDDPGEDSPPVSNPFPTPPATDDPLTEEDDSDGTDPYVLVSFDADESLAAPSQAVATSSMTVTVTRKERPTLSIETAEPTPPPSPSVEVLLQQPELWQEIDSLTEEMRSEGRVHDLIVGVTSFLSFGLSVGYLLWASRISYALSILISSLPAWKVLDPLPILDHFERQSVDPEAAADRGGESLATLLERDRRPEQGP